ncbi:hypothetical protein Tdes44962_MAKER03970 [Teratosphaeria destructans]|uniref:Uncharacterized protein n=1 Tax=Teratosphaeria destructans TaxID=418781 RepID=A0A9W7W0Y5_9PEZI|nr:hypothetical protein Tdes44962_MAKER03970 [Teratosphaeria destructans]
MSPRQSKPRCHFLEIPAELRLEIYGHALGGPGTYVFNTSIFDDVLISSIDNRWDRGVKPDVGALSLLRSCKQIYREAHEVLVSSVLFTAYVEGEPQPELAGTTRGMSKGYEYEAGWYRSLGSIQDWTVLRQAQRLEIQVWSMMGSSKECSALQARRVGALLKGLDCGRYLKTLDVCLRIFDGECDYEALYQALKDVDCGGRVTLRTHPFSLRYQPDEKIAELASAMGA